MLVAPLPVRSSVIPHNHREKPVAESSMVRGNPHSAKGETVFTAGEGANAPTTGAARDVVCFRRAVVALARDGERAHALEAASAVLRLASSGEERILRGLLRPDPSGDAVAWTVACYQIGDLTPSALRDFSDASAAVRTLAACGEAHHVAAELLASTSTGLTWTPLSRTGEQIVFHLFAADTSRPGEPERSGPSSESERSARQAWDALLSRWDTEPEADLLAARAGGSGPADLPERVEGLEARLGLLEEQVHALLDRLQGDVPLPAGPDPSGAVGP